jgi:hypothetical protein
MPIEAPKRPGSNLESELNRRLEQYRGPAGLIGLTSEQATQELVDFLWEYYRRNSTSRAYPGAGISGAEPSTTVEALFRISKQSSGPVFDLEEVKHGVEQVREEKDRKQQAIDREIDFGGKA